MRAETGYRYVWPRPDPSEQKHLYERVFYENDHPGILNKMERELDYWNAIWSLRRERFEATLGSGPHRLLDVGCSGGFLLNHFEKHGWSTMGIEPSRRAVEYARERFGMDIHQGTVEDYCPSEPFDVVHSSKVLEHVPDPERVVRLIASWVRPGGLVYFELPNDFNPLQIAARDSLDKPSWWVVPRHHLNYFDYDSLSALLAQHGLEEVERVASFPMEMFLLMGRDYIGQPEVGAECHAMRMQLEKTLIESGHADALRRLYDAFADSSMGRTCAVLARKATAD